MYKFNSHSINVGFNFGVTSGIITTLGLMVGLNSGTHSKLAVIGGVLTIAVADAFSDALGIHISEESENIHSTREVWESTIVTFFSKFLFSLLFVIPVLLFSLKTAVIVSFLCGLSTLGFVSYLLAKRGNINPYKVIFEHLLIAVIVVFLSHFTGAIIAHNFQCY